MILGFEGVIDSLSGNGWRDDHARVHQWLQNVLFLGGGALGRLVVLIDLLFFVVTFHLFFLFIILIFLQRSDSVIVVLVIKVFIYIINNLPSLLSNRLLFLAHLFKSSAL